MKSRNAIMRLMRFQVDEKRRRIAQIELMITEFDRVATDLEREIAVEEQRAGVTDKSHFAYPTYARAAFHRKENLIRSTYELREQLADACDELGEVSGELKRLETLVERERAELAREQAQTDRIGLAMHGFART